MNSIYRGILSLIGIGFIPIAPGTFGSLLALPITWFLFNTFGTYGIIITLIFLTILAIIITLQIDNKNKDPSWIVMDEFCGQMLVLIFVEASLIYYIYAFILFRIFDIFKPWPINLIDNKMKNAFGIYLDDFAASFYAIIVIYLTSLIS